MASLPYKLRQLLHRVEDEEESDRQLYLLIAEEFDRRQILRQLERQMGLERLRRQALEEVGNIIQNRNFDRNALIHHVAKEQSELGSPISLHTEKASPKSVSASPSSLHSTQGTTNVSSIRSHSDGPTPEPYLKEGFGKRKTKTRSVPVQSKLPSGTSSAMLLGKMTATKRIGNGNLRTLMDIKERKRGSWEASASYANGGVGRGVDAGVRRTSHAGVRLNPINTKTSSSSSRKSGHQSKPVERKIQFSDDATNASETASETSSSYTAGTRSTAMSVNSRSSCMTQLTALSKQSYATANTSNVYRPQVSDVELAEVAEEIRLKAVIALQERRLQTNEQGTIYDWDNIKALPMVADAERASKLHRLTSTTSNEYSSLAPKKDPGKEEETHSIGCDAASFSDSSSEPSSDALSVEKDDEMEQLLKELEAADVDADPAEDQETPVSNDGTSDAASTDLERHAAPVQLGNVVQQTVGRLVSLVAVVSEEATSGCASDTERTPEAKHRIGDLLMLLVTREIGEQSFAMSTPKDSAHGDDEGDHDEIHLDEEDRSSASQSELPPLPSPKADDDNGGVSEAQNEGQGEDRDEGRAHAVRASAMSVMQGAARVWMAKQRVQNKRNSRWSISSKATTESSSPMEDWKYC